MARPRNPEWIDWRTSAARKIVLEDLDGQVLPLEDDVVSAQEAWDDIYSHLPEFRDVVFSQFKARLKDHRKQVGRKHQAVYSQLHAYEHDRRLYPRQTHNQHGERVFDLSAAKPLLREDVVDEKHIEMTVEALHNSRPEYREWNLGIFRRRLRQEIRTQKWYYYLDWKRAKKRQKRGLRNEDPGPDSEARRSQYHGNPTTERRSTTPQVYESRTHANRVGNGSIEGV